MKKNLSSLFYLLFGIGATFVIINIILQNPYYKPFHLIISTSLCILGFIFIYKIICQNERILAKNYNKILIIFSALMLFVEIAFGIILRYDPQWDVGAVNKAAWEWADTGTFKGYFDYFYGFPNNLGAMTYLSIFLRAAKFIGITDYYTVSVVINSITIVATMALVSLVCRKLSDEKHGILALTIFAVGVQFWFMGGAVYTDTLSMVFPVLVFWMYLISKEYEGRKRIIIYILMGIAAAVGALIKITSFIMIISVVIDMCFNDNFKRNFKKILTASVCFLGITAIVFLSFNAYIYSFYLDKEITYEKSRPYSHWVMMGLNGDGAYNPDDYKFTDEISDPEERREKISEEIYDRIKERGFSGMYELFTQKTVRNLGDGTYGTADFLGINPKNDTSLHDWILYDGKYFNKYGTYATSIHLVFIIFAAIQAYYFISSKKRKDLMPAYIGIFGLYLFLLMWESQRRYFTNFIPIILTCGVLGIDLFIDTCKRIISALNNSFKH